MISIDLNMNHHYSHPTQSAKSIQNKIKKTIHNINRNTVYVTQPQSIGFEHRRIAHPAIGVTNTRGVYQKYVTKQFQTHVVLKTQITHIGNNPECIQSACADLTTFTNFKIFKKIIILATKMHLYKSKSIN